jgi:hypothetical protein
MPFLKRYPVLSTLLILCVAAFIAEAAFVYVFSLKVRTQTAALKKSQQELSTAAANSIAPTDDNLKLAKANVDDLNQELSKDMSALEHTNLEMPPEPKDTVELLSKVDGYVSSSRTAAKDKGVILPKDFTFGLGEYYGHVSPPSPDKIPAVWKQMTVLKYLLDKLFTDAKSKNQAMMLVGVSREDVAATPTPGGAPASTDTTATGDIFTEPALVSARVPGAIDTLAFRLEFIGYSDALRIFLNDVAKFDYPLVVRSVEVQPAKEATITSAQRTSEPTPSAGSGMVLHTTGGSNGESKTSAPKEAAKAPIIKDNLSDFTIIVEYIELVKDTSADAAAAPAAGTAPAPKS